MPKNVKGTLWALLTYILLQNIKKLERGTNTQLKNFQKKSHNAEKNERGDPFVLISADRTGLMVVVLVVSIVRKVSE